VPRLAESWRTLRSRLVYRTPWVELREDEVRLPAGRRIRHAVVTLGTGRSVGVLPVLPSGEIVLVRQYRYVQQGWYWEAPSGAPRPGEALEAAAQRELREEAGYRAGRLLPLTRLHTSKSVCRETAHLYAAFDLAPDPLPADPTEDFEVAAFPPAEVAAMVERAEIMDAMTVVAVLWAARNGLLNLS
jgi:ADP-ribose pyrophosphatase